MAPAVALTVSQKLWLQYIESTEVQRGDCVGTKFQRSKEQCSAWSLLQPSSLSASHQRLPLRQGAENGTIPTVAVNCGQVCLVAKFSVEHTYIVAWAYCTTVCSWSLCFAGQRLQLLLSKFQICTHTCI